ncbi:LysM peptidoglycan-binding domain-containing protein [Nonlabens sp. SY33080]|uniref:LysM peptidoglycan-binding domain-containing protein n=1 Tax=Nonlabens sp. SY33080 TaxID=2719911 RepID=UPI001F0FEC4F|nr:LysM peptidoglycan-binding domain-containing protein [Nonlabens sp. SY33080]
MRSRILGICLSIIGMVILHAQQPDSVAVKRKVFTYEEYKQKQSVKDSLKTDSLKVESTTVTNTVIPILEIEDGSGLKEYPEVDEFDENLLEELYNNDLYDYMYDDFVNLDDAAIVEQVVPTDTLKARLKRINATTPFNIEYNPILEKLINKKLSYRRVYLERLMTLSDYYFPMFEEQLDQYDIPLEMKYLAVVESALDAKAKSRVGATGMWQFMFATGRNYGLEVNSYVDERMDPEKATVAACKFLRSLYNIYGDWDLALAAYNSGPGNVNKAIRRSGGYRNYWNLRPYLPRETAGYVPAFQAMLYLFTYASEHGFKPLQNEHRSIVTDSVQVKKMIALEHVAQFTDQDIEVVQFHNPSYKLDLIPVVEGRKYYLRLPLKAMSKFVSNEDSVYAFAKAEFDKREKPLPELLKAESRVVYRVKSGDYLGKIANKYGVSVSKLKRWNNLRSSKLRIGQKLYIHPRRPVATIPVSQNNTSTTHKVKSGDSFWTIARKYGTSVRNLKKLNPDKTENLKPGMVLKLK